MDSSEETNIEEVSTAATESEPAAADEETVMPEAVQIEDSDESSEAESEPAASGDEPGATSESDLVADGGENAPTEPENNEAPGTDEVSTTAAADSDEPTTTPPPEPTPELPDLLRDIEAVLFISPEPVSLEVLAEVTGGAGEELAHAVEAVRAKYSDPACGIAFAEVAGGYTFRSSDAAREAVERFCARPVDYSLSAAAMETLAIIAYLQPITRPEVARIRGVGADTVVANLMDKGLVEEAGRHKHTNAIKYRTTADFQKLFGLADLTGLPHLDGFEATAQDVEELRAKLYTAAEKRQ